MAVIGPASRCSRHSHRMMAAAISARSASPDGRATTITFRSTASTPAVSRSRRRNRRSRLQISQDAIEEYRVNSADYDVSTALSRADNSMSKPNMAPTTITAQFLDIFATRFLTRAISSDYNLNNQPAIPLLSFGTVRINCR